MARKKKSPYIEISAGRASLVGLLAGAALSIGAAALLVVVTDDYSANIAEAHTFDASYVVVANRDLHPGVRIGPGDVYMVAVPLEVIPEGSFRDPSHVVDRYAAERILANEFIRRQRLVDPESGTGMNAVVPVNMRALSIELTDGSALSGHLVPGSYVDVLVTISPEGDKADAVTVTAAQGLFVMAVNKASVVEQTPQEARDHGERRLPPSVTLLVDPEDAERIAHAKQQGSVRLTLRNELDRDYQVRTGVDVEVLLENLKVEPAWPQKKDEGVAAEPH